MKKQAPRRKKKAADDSLVSFAELIALCRTRRIVREENGAIIGVEVIDGAEPSVTPDDVLKANSFLGRSQHRPLEAT